MAAIVHPRFFPVEFEATQSSFDAEALSEISRTRGGRVTGYEEVGGNLWQAHYVSIPLDDAAYGSVHAWKIALGGVRESFKGYDPSRKGPSAYMVDNQVVSLPALRFDGSAFDGTCSMTALTGSLMTLGNLPDGYIVTVGDYVSFPWFGTQNLVKALDTLAANSSGVIADIPVGPWRRAGGTVPVTATLSPTPWCLMKMLPGTWRGDRTFLDPVTFDAIQTV